VLDPEPLAEFFDALAALLLLMRSLVGAHCFSLF
jgi:hypothetical protein